MTVTKPFHFPPNQSEAMMHLFTESAMMYSMVCQMTKDALANVILRNPTYWSTDPEWYLTNGWIIPDFIQEEDGTNIRLLLWSVIDGQYKTYKNMTRQDFHWLIMSLSHLSGGN